MPELNLDCWTDFKSLCVTTKNLPIQYVNDGNQYDIYGPDSNGILWHVTIPITDPENSDQTDFETTVMPVANGVIGTTLSPFAQPTVRLSGDSVSTTITAGASGTMDYYINPAVFPTGIYITGGTMIGQNTAFGDTIKAQVVDINDELGFGPNFVAATYIRQFFVQVPENDQATVLMELDTNFAAYIPPGLYLRIIYNSVGSTNPNIAINYKLHVSTIMTTGSGA